MPHTTDTVAAREEGWVQLGSGAELRELLGEPWPVVIEKVHDRLTEQDRDVLARSPFCLLATSDTQGNCDVSPRGDAPGFTHVVDSGTIALPDRPGNRRGDSFHNILDNPHAGLLYLIPGGKEVLRVNGRARILTDAPFFDAMTAQDGKRPALALVLEIDEIYLHCPQSLRRSGVWNPASWQTG
ncbi:MSMEG_1061 family FMN-dependent PPOX-type flavoprotein [Streptomyces sp. NPDC050546]|uniref:MSMEG_1061 family FMN-dependent PPOX-type flavoprotein n=1 Tax=Streptomyces sp. NPDC050546 TaxID=3365628 RepID=UPI00378FD9EF